MESPLIENVGSLNMEFIKPVSILKTMLTSIKLLKSEIYGLKTLSLSLSFIYKSVH